MLIQKLPQMPYTTFPLDWQVWAQEKKFILHSAYLFRDERWPCWETKYYIADLESSGVNAPACFVAEQWTVSKLDALSQHNRLSLSTGHLNFVSVRHK